MSIDGSLQYLFFLPCFYSFWCVFGSFYKRIWFYYNEENNICLDHEQTADWRHLSSCMQCFLYAEKFF